MEEVRHAAVTVIGKDRPGIVAGVTRVLYDVGCNLEDVSSTILRGHFSMVVIVRLPERADLAELQARLDGAAAALGIAASVRLVQEVDPRSEAPTHMVSVYGSDRPGIVFKVTDALARRNVNITDLTSRVIGESDSPVYALMLEVAAPAGEDLESDLAALRAELGVDVSVHPIAADVL